MLLWMPLQDCKEHYQSNTTLATLNAWDAAASRQVLRTGKYATE